MSSKFPSQIQHEIGFIGFIVEERFAKVDEYGGEMILVCQTIVTAPGIPLHDSQNDMLMWLVSVQGSRGVCRRLGTAVALSQVVGII